MERVLGIGGIFFKARDPKRLATWYRDHLGVPIEGGESFGTFAAESAQEGTPEDVVWSTFPEETTYFDPSPASFMVNYRVRDLDKMLDQLREAGVEVDDRVESHVFGRFGWTVDPEGNRFELWEPSRDA
ncbi:MAG: VOC family protein [Bacteroidota bacterium]